MTSIISRWKSRKARTRAEWERAEWERIARTRSHIFTKQEIAEWEKRRDQYQESQTPLQKVITWGVLIFLWLLLTFR